MATAQTPIEDRIEALRRVGLGFAKSGLDLISYDPRWKRAFSDEAYAIFDALRMGGLRLYHIGSTSIPGIVAKPIIDILGSVTSIEAVDAKRDDLEKIGYSFKGENGIAGRRYCTLQARDGSLGFAHLHIFEHVNPQIKTHLLFRDYLRSNAEAASLYEATKIDFIKQGVSRTDYTDAKAPVIQTLLDEAHRWSCSKKKVLAILGSAADGKQTRAYLEELRSQHDSFEVFDLTESAVSPFFYNRNLHTTNDQHIRLIEAMIDADLVLLATPVYWYAMSGAMKDFMDRFSDLLGGPYKHLGEKLYGKKIELIATGYDEALPMGFEVPFTGTAMYFGCDYMGARYKSVR